MGKNGQYWLTVIAAFCLSANAALSSTAMGYFIVPVTAEFGYSRAEFSLFMSFMALATMIALPFVGRMTDKLGFRKVVLIGCLWSMVGFAALSFCTSLISFYVAATFLGLMCVAFSTVVAGSIISKWFAARKGFFLGIVMASTGISGTIISLILPTFIPAYGWRNAFLLLAGCTLILSLPALIFLKNKPEDLGLKPYGYVEETKKQSTATAAQADLKLSQVIFSPKFIGLYIAFVLLTIPAAGFTRQMPAFLAGIGKSPLEVGSLMSVFLIALIFAKILMGALNDAIGLIKSVAVVLLLYLISFALLPINSSFALVAVAFALMSSGGGAVGVYPPLITSEAFGQKNFATIYSALYTSTTVGTIIGTPLWGWIYDATGSYNPGIIATIPLIVVVFAIVFFSTRVRKPDARNISA
ncbi:MFS transporter [Desulfitobacterium hafniense]|uniref:Major facilitator superfamily (MFS) profile domain-containing protein n=1 Tax=Desulfitobacterium hafniense (strain Y51) TaxID=138119 RepID=Q24QW3_DESHY|nr:MFS transporter [Desulfitobacterium hafniense]BAE85579.1 hypothetical protein DSY3790 [Desulfitobacterium hafniense Y51]